MSDWRIHRREQRCARCARSFEEREAIFSLLFIDADRLRREDHCAGCFEQPAGEPRTEMLFWRTLHTLDRRARFAVDFEAIEELFVRLEPGLEGRGKAGLQELRYLLALLLLRKKRLKLVGVRRNPSGETLCLRRPRRQEEFEVQVFELDSERAMSLKAELARVFEGAGADALANPMAATAPPVPNTSVADACSREPGG